MKVGFIGLGIMGNPMAKNLLKGQVELYVNDVNKEAENDLVLAGAVKVDDLNHLGSLCDVIILMLPNADIVKTVLFGVNGIASTLKGNSIVVDMSSLSPIDSKEINEKLALQEVEYLDSPVSGGQPKAIDGTLSVMIGGSEKAIETVRPILNHLAADIVRVGDSGSGSTVKLANQILVNVTIAALSEAAILAAKAGVDLNKMHAAIRNGLAGSAVLNAKLPLIINRNFVAGGRIDINTKDLLNIEETGRALGVPLPLTTTVLGMFHCLKADGKAGDDHAGLVQYYEKLANFEISKGGK